METSLLIVILILLISLTISFIGVIVDYSIFKKRIEKILDSNIEVNNSTQEVLNITKEVNISVGQICELNDKLIKSINYSIQENNFLRNKLEDKKETNEE